MKKGQPHIPINHRLSNKHWRKVEIQRTVCMLVGHSLVSWHHHWRPGNMGGPWNLMGGHSIQNSVRNIKVIDAIFAVSGGMRVPGRLASHVFNQEPRSPRKEEKPPQGRLLQLPASNSLCFTKFRRAPRQVHKGLQPLLGKGVQRAGFQLAKQTNKDSKSLEKSWANIQHVSGIRPGGICHLSGWNLAFKSQSSALAWQDSRKEDSACFRKCESLNKIHRVKLYGPIKYFQGKIQTV